MNHSPTLNERPNHAFHPANEEVVPLSNRTSPLHPAYIIHSFDFTSLNSSKSSNTMPSASFGYSNDTPIAEYAPIGLPSEGHQSHTSTASDILRDFKFLSLHLGI
jgi:hypothetical protein